MNTQDEVKKDIGSTKRSSVGKGLIIFLIGLFFLVRNLDLHLPGWVLSWEVLLICIGLIIFTVSGFKNYAGLVLMGVGATFLSKEFLFLSFDISRYIWPTILILVGIIIIFKKPGTEPCRSRRRRRFGKYEGYEKYDNYPEMIINEASEDYADATAIFSGVNRIVVSKNFKGGRATAIFGGVDFNLIQADFNGVIEIDVDCVFGGVEIVVPSNWEVKARMDTTFGGVEDKRPPELISHNPDKVLIIKGNCIFGGVEIKSYI